MVLFYTKNITEDVAIFEDDELRHLSQSLRKSAGETIHFIDGEGGRYTGIIMEISRKEAKVKIVAKQHEVNDVPPLHIAISPTKNMDRIEFFLEKAVEIGVQEISFILCKHSERKHMKWERMQRIMISASKQSKKAHFPILNALKPFDEWISTINSEHRYIATLLGQAQKLNNLSVQEETVVCIGPEGGFRDTEVDLAHRYGFQSLSLGNQRLRTETAGIYTASIFQFIYNRTY